MKRSNIVFALVAILLAAVFTYMGFAVGIVAAKGISFKSDLTADGLIAGFTAGVAVLAATIILPMLVQPHIYKQRGFNKVIQGDTTNLLALIEEILEDYRLKHDAGTPITVKERQSFLAKHKKINNLARVIKQQAKASAALSNFEEKVYNPLTDSQGEFSDKALPKAKLNDTIYLPIKNNLDAISYSLQEIRYKLF